MTSAHYPLWFYSSTVCLYAARSFPLRERIQYIFRDRKVVGEPNINACVVDSCGPSTGELGYSVCRICKAKSFSEPCALACWKRSEGRFSLR
ncbi:hypothetical protein AVEN_170616-1 [Araneus ventricosus]|uniref:Uncharacterized protein n=1 Tax=Araneus ventricosus TaxID=182803 RepID=A0A4Y2UNA4_ARAVE|nr:hypothetical protein AVEN_170616-1 [Araneus ventricosus]